MKLAATVLAGTLIAIPAFANATTYRLDAIVSGVPTAFGTVSIDPGVVVTGLTLSRSCPQFSPCNQSGPWDQVTFNLSANIQDGVTGTGPGAIADISLLFGANGDVTGGSIQVEAPEGGPGVAFLRAALNSGPGPCSGTELCGTYIPAQFADPLPVSISFVQTSDPIPEPRIGWPLLLAGLVGLPWLAGTRHYASPRPHSHGLGS